MEEQLKIEHLSKSFKLSKKQQRKNHNTAKRKIAVNDITFAVGKGEVFGLLGPNGAGKTTTLRMIATLMKPDSGDIFVQGINATNGAEVRKKLGFLTSELKLDGFFSPGYLFDFFSDLYGIDSRTRNERKQTLFHRFGIDEFADVKMQNLSTGMKQKVSLVISLVNDPEIIVFDEPTNGLDIITAKVVTDFLLELKSTGKTIIISTHIFSLIEKLCDRVGVILDGRLVLCDTLEHLTKEKSLEEKFFEIYEKAGGENE